VIAVIFFIAVVSSCARHIDEPSVSEEFESPFSSYLDFPGITEDDINAVDNLRSHVDEFILGAFLSTETFIDENGELNGFSVLLCDWLTELLDIPFRPQLFEADDLWTGLEAGTVSFTRERKPVDLGIQTFSIDGAIASRPFTYFRIPDSLPLSEIAQSRPLRFAFFEGTTTLELASAYITNDFEAIMFGSIGEIYEALTDGDIDAFIGESTFDAAFDAIGDIEESIFIPLLYSPVAFMTANPMYEPIITVLKKGLGDPRGARHLSELYYLGDKEYTKSKLFMRFTDEERDYLNNNRVIYIMVEYSNYPVTFIDPGTGEWKGIDFDIMRAVEQLTGLEFRVYNDPDTDWGTLLPMIENGDVPMVSDLIRTHDREGRFIWLDSTHLVTQYVLISREEHRNISINEVPFVSVALSQGTGYTEIFQSWFPNHNYSVVYDNIFTATEAFLAGEVDMLMGNKNSFLHLSQFMELPGYKINFVFEGSGYDSTFGFNKDEVVLASIFNKSLEFIDTELIFDQWQNKTFDYRLRVAEAEREAQRPLFISISILAVVVLALVGVFLVKSRYDGRRLEKLVEQRTKELEFRTVTLKNLLESIEESYNRAKELSDALAEITKSPSISAGDLISAAEIIARRGCIALNVDIVAIWSYSDEKNVLECIKAYSASEDKMISKSDYDMSRDVSYVERIFAERLIIENNISDSFPDSYLMSNPNICAMLEAPVNISGKYYGSISIEQERCEQYPDGREWKIEEQQFASSLADIMALVISGSQRRLARDAAETASRYKSDFIASMSHEIRTPMNVILGITEILVHDESLTDSVSEGLSRIYNSGDMLLGIINDILDLSKIEAGKLELYLADYETASLINDTAVLNYMRNESKAVEFTISVSENIPSVLYGDELRIKQILNNMLSNAFKYTESGEITLGFDIELNNGKKQNAVLVLTVRDTGQGMTKEQVTAMFDEFTRFNFGANRTKEGTGLGMSITRKLIELMNGEIYVNSELGKGTEFTVHLPQIYDGSEILGRELADNLQKFNQNELKRMKKANVVFEPMPYGRVLIVDDMESNLYVTRGLMNPYELDIETVNSGFKAIDKINAGNIYDIIFMDHMMPKMDGMEATKIIRETGYTGTIVALTANAIIGQMDVFLENGFDDFVSKPVDVRYLNTVLKKYIQEKQPEEVLEAVRKKMHNSKKIIRHDDSKPVLSAQFIEFFLIDANQAVGKLEEFVKKGENFNEEDNKAFTIAVHSMKNALANVGEQKLSFEAERLEKAGWNNDKEKFGDIPGFIKKLKAVITKHSPQDEDDIEVELTKSDYTDLKEKVLIIKEANEAFDNKTAKENIKLLREKKWSERIRLLLGEMSEQLLSGGDTEVSVLADKIAEICDKNSV